MSRPGFFPWRELEIATQPDRRTHVPHQSCWTSSQSAAKQTPTLRTAGLEVLGADPRVLANGVALDGGDKKSKLTGHPPGSADPRPASSTQRVAALDRARKRRVQHRLIDHVGKGVTVVGSGRRWSILRCSRLGPGPRGWRPRDSRTHHLSGFERKEPTAPLTRTRRPSGHGLVRVCANQIILSARAYLTVGRSAKASASSRGGPGQLQWLCSHSGNNGLWSGSLLTHSSRQHPCPGQNHNPRHLLHPHIPQHTTADFLGLAFLVAISRAHGGNADAP